MPTPTRGGDDTRSTREKQRDFVEHLRHDSFLGRDFPIAYHDPQSRSSVERGMTLQDYYSAKIRRGEVGKYDPLYQWTIVPARFQRRAS